MPIEKSNEPDAFAGFEHRGWNEVGEEYDRYWGPVTSQAVEPLLDASRAGAGMRLLDACCGPGKIAAAAAARGAQATGLDFAAEMVEIARRKLPDVEIVEGDVQALPFDDGHFDAVVCGYGIVHVPDPQTALTELCRVLRRGGRLAVSVWEPPLPGNGFGLFYGAVRTHGDLGVPLPHGPDFFQFSGEDSLAAALVEAGLAEPTVRRVEQFWECLDPRGFINGIVEGSVRARGLILAQSAEVRERIFADIVEGMARFATGGDGYRVPMPALVGSGIK